MASINQLPVPTTLSRPSTTSPQAPATKCPSFLIATKDRSYKHQYANIYFIRLRVLRQFVEERAKKRWKRVAGNPILVPRVLEVVKSQLCWIVGTVYMDMPLKPNILEDIARDQSIPPPPPLKKFASPEDRIMLEDESGRIGLIGERLKLEGLVTGVVVGVLGMETPNGEFEVADVCYAGVAPRVNSLPDERMDVDDTIPPHAPSPSESPCDEWIAMISGLEISPTSSPDAQIQLLIEYLTGEGGGTDEQASASRISRLIITGNSLAPQGSGTEGDKKVRRYGHDSMSFSPHPIINLSAHLLDLAQVMPVHLLPGPLDPSGAILPQQPFPRAMFGSVSNFSSFTCETNPTYLPITSTSYDNSTNQPSRPNEIERTFLVNSGQPLNDMWKYLPSPPATRLSLAEATLRWRHIAPTAPDTLWCHPYFSEDPFIIQEAPDVYVIGDQPRFQTKLLVDTEEGNQKECRIVLLPRFSETGVLVLVNLRTLGVKTVKFDTVGMSGGVGRS